MEFLFNFSQRSFLTFLLKLLLAFLPEVLTGWFYRSSCRDFCRSSSAPGFLAESSRVSPGMSPGVPLEVFVNVHSMLRLGFIPEVVRTYIPQLLLRFLQIFL